MKAATFIRFLQLPNGRPPRLDWYGPQPLPVPLAEPQLWLRLSGGGSPDRLARRRRRGGDLMRGNTGNDLLRGNSGNDRLFGGPGFDVLIGGSGFDLTVQ